MPYHEQWPKVHAPLSSRRMRDMYNSIGTYVRGVRARTPYNPAYLNPQEMASLGIASGDHIEITSDSGRIIAVAAADETVRPGVLRMPGVCCRMMRTMNRVVATRLASAC